MNYYSELSRNELSLSQPVQQLWSLAALCLALDPSVSCISQFKQPPVVVGDIQSYVGWSQLSAWAPGTRYMVL